MKGGTDVSGKAWTRDELGTLRELYPTSTARELSARLGRTAKAIHEAAKLYGLTKRMRTAIDARFLDRLRSLNADGHCDTAIADALGCERHTAAKWRAALGLPSHARGERYVTKVREKTAAQLDAAGLPSLAMVRVKAFREFAASRGWPVDLPPRAVMILDAFSMYGPMTRKQIAAAIGMEWHGSRASLKSGTPRGSYLAELVALGLVVDLGRIVKGTGKGHSVHLYALALAAIPEERSR